MQTSKILFYIYKHKNLNLKTHTWEISEQIKETIKWLYIQRGTSGFLLEKNKKLALFIIWLPFGDVCII